MIGNGIDAESYVVPFGKYLFEPGDDLIITEGEIDAMSFYECGGKAMSVPRGVGSSANQNVWIEHAWELIRRASRSC